jgi:hypothetical protein
MLHQFISEQRVYNGSLLYSANTGLQVHSVPSFYTLEGAKLEDLTTYKNINSVYVLSRRGGGGIDQSIAVRSASEKPADSALAGVVETRQLVGPLKIDDPQLQPVRRLTSPPLLLLVREYQPPAAETDDP